MLKPDCLFCKIVAHQLPSHKVWEDLNYLAFLSIFPNTEGFTVVIPKYHLSSYLFDHSAQEVNGLMEATRTVAGLLVCKLETVARTALIFEGYGVNHLHAKLIPLHGTAGKSWEEISTLDHRCSTKFDTYPGYVSSHDAERASDEALDKLAHALRVPSEGVSFEGSH